MRYYRIEVFNEDGSAYQRDGVPVGWTSYVGGKTVPTALQVEFDVPVTLLATPLGAASIKIWGIALQLAGQASDFNGKMLKLYAGMQKGLPLANPAQSGLILQGSINQAFGNWIGINQWIEFIVVTNGAALGESLNIVLDWKKGTKLADAIQQTLATAVPKFKVEVTISDKLVLSEGQAGFYQSMTQFAQYLKQVSLAILGGADGYSGVDVLITEDTFKVFDGTTPAAPKPIAFNDLIGQPTWIDPATVQITTVMRADLEPTDYIQLPATQVTTTAGSLSQYRNKSVFQGPFFIREMRHIGNFRQADALAWVTTMNCSPTTASA